MTELKEELKPRTGEGAVEYAERTEAALERHHQETGERIHPQATLPDEGPGETLVRIKVLREADGIREASKARERQQRAGEKTEATSPQERKGMTPAEESTRWFRLSSQERDVERAAAQFEEARKRLYRKDGSKVYGEVEHGERTEKLASELREKVEAVTKEAEEDAMGYDRGALALSYSDPVAGLTGTERERLTVSMPLVKEDCQGMALAGLAERLSAVSAGTDKVSKVLHARYARRRQEAEDARLSEQARNGTRRGAPDTDTAALRRVLGLAGEIEGQIKDPEAERRREAFTEAAKKSRETIRNARRRLSAADGTEERARRKMAERTRAAF